MQSGALIGDVTAGCMVINSLCLAHLFLSFNAPSQKWEDDESPNRSLNLREKLSRKFSLSKEYKPRDKKAPHDSKTAPFHSWGLGIPLASLDEFCAKIVSEVCPGSVSQELSQTLVKRDFNIFLVPRKRSTLEVVILFCFLFLIFFTEFFQYPLRWTKVLQGALQTLGQCLYRKTYRNLSNLLISEEQIRIC